MQAASGIACALSVCLVSAQDSRPTSTSAPKPLAVSGRVVDVRGEGIAIARVRVAALTERATTLAEGSCDGQGWFRIEGVPPRAGLTVEGSLQGFARGSTLLSSPGHPVTLMLSEAATVRGVLRDAKGQPVAGATVRALSELIMLTGAHTTATTADDGRFTLPAVALGATRIESLAPGGGLAETRVSVDGDCEVVLAVAEGQTTSLRVEVQGLPPERRDEARLGVLLYRGNRGAMLPPPAEDPRLAKDGTFTIAGIPDREYRVQIALPGFTFTPRDARLEAGAGPHVVVFRAKPLLAGNVRAVALVRDPDGEPLAGIPLDLRVGRELASTAISDAQGRLEFTVNAVAGTKVSLGSVDPAWVVAAMMPGGARSPIPAVGSRHEFILDPRSVREVMLLPACSVTGRVEEIGGAAAAHTSIVLEQHAEGRAPAWLELARTTTDRQGAYEFARVQKGIGTLRIRVGGTHGESFASRDDLPVTDAGILRLSAPATVEGTLTSAQGVPLPGRRIELRAWDQDRNTRASGSRIQVLTDRAGRYRIRGAPVGTAILQVEPEEATGVGPTPEPFEVVQGRTVTKDLRAR